MNGYALTVVLCCLTATVVDACSQPANATYLGLPGLAQQADLVVSALYAAESLVVQRTYKSGQLYQKVVDVTFRVASVHRLSKAVAGVGCTPGTITVRGVVLLDACVDFRRSMLVGKDYIVALKYQSGTYTLLDQSQLCAWALTNANVAAMQQTPLAPGQVSGANAAAVCSLPGSSLPTTTTVAATSGAASTTTTVRAH